VWIESQQFAPILWCFFVHQKSCILFVFVLCGFGKEALRMDPFYGWIWCILWIVYYIPYWNLYSFTNPFKLLAKEKENWSLKQVWKFFNLSCNEACTKVWSYLTKVLNWNCSYLLSSLFKILYIYIYIWCYHWEMKNTQSLAWLCEGIFPCWSGIKLIESKLGTNEEIRMWTSLVSKLPFQEWIQLWNFLYFKIEIYMHYITQKAILAFLLLDAWN